MSPRRAHRPATTPIACLCLAALLVASGCGTTATIYTRRGQVVEAEILRTSGEELVIESRSGESTLRKDEITDIDHPGNVVLLIGGLIGAYGIANIIVGMPQCEKEGGAFCVGVFTPAAIGLGMTMFGGVVWGGSRKAAGMSKSKSEKTLAAWPLVVVPMAVVAGEEVHRGAGVVVAF